VLKLLQAAYAGAVKLIYIDPPYNTGNDFVYPDDFRAGVRHYKELTQQTLSTNAETSGRYHSDWLKMMHPRLALARNLLRDDGVIFVSIDDHEVHNLRLLMDEVFGEENFVAQVIWKKRSTPPNDKILGANHDYILCYALQLESAGLNLRERTEEQEARYKNPDNHPKGPWAPGDLMANVKGGRYVESLYFPIRNPNTGEDHYPGKDGNWRFNREKIDRLIANNEISFGEDGKGRPKLKRFLCDVKEGTTYPTIWDFVPFNTEGSAEMTEIFGSLTTFENPKPTGLLLEIVKCAAGPSDLILDFFAGSGTTGQAVLELNRQDGGNRKFILVQFPEPAGREDFKTIADITRERVRRVIARRPADLASGKPEGFRAYRLDDSNFKLWDADAAPADAAVLAKQLELIAHNVLDGRGDDDLLAELLLKCGHPGVTLTSAVETREVAGAPVYLLAEGRLAICLAQALTQEVLRGTIALKPQRVLCLDVGFQGNDQLKTNTVLEMKSHGIQFQTV
jgi:adenine-specific DNA-methyltransferase